MNTACAPQERTPATPRTRDTLARHRAVWGNKPLLRQVYRDYYKRILERCSPARPIVELGCGPGFFKEACPEIVATDCESTAWCDRVVDACALPFGDSSVGSIVMVDVFHHIPRPTRFLEEAARVLQPGGRIVMLEPWTSALGYLFYRYIHHEGADWNVDATEPFRGQKEAFDGNAALPRMYVESANDELIPRTLRLLAARRIPALTWLATGGFQKIKPVPESLFWVVNGMELAAQVLSRWIALRGLITLERRPADAR